MNSPTSKENRAREATALFNESDYPIVVLRGSTFPIHTVVFDDPKLGEYAKKHQQ